MFAALIQLHSVLNGKTLDWKYDTRFPTTADLRRRAQKRLPGFAFEYLDGGCNEDQNMHKNVADLATVELKPHYLSDFSGSSLQTELFGQVYDAPFGIAPVGLQGLMWPNAAEILAKAAFDHNIPFVLSTVTTANIERVAELTNGSAWFQLYHPAEKSLRDDLLKRLQASQYQVLVITCDVPTLGFRPRDIKNGLSMPPKMTLKNILQMIGKPKWALYTLRHGQPQFKNIQPYIPQGLNLKHLGLFMKKTFAGRVDEEKIAPIRDIWKGKLVLKGVESTFDAEMAIRLGADGIIVSNHGGRQLEVAPSSIRSLITLAPQYAGKIKIMMDSGLRSGPDIARALASGAEFTFLGKTFMYGVGALGAKGGHHTISMLKAQLQQIMEQLCCEKVRDLPKHLVRDFGR